MTLKRSSQFKPMPTSIRLKHTRKLFLKNRDYLKIKQFENLEAKCVYTHEDTTTMSRREYILLINMIDIWECLECD